jgi:hypothetical protein
MPTSASARVCGATRGFQVENPHARHRYRHIGDAAGARKVMFAVGVSAADTRARERTGDK